MLSGFSGSYPYGVFTEAFCVLVITQSLTLTHSHTHTFTLAAQNQLRIRNMNISNPFGQYEGIVEVYHNGQWGTVCDTRWTYQDALLACLTAGFQSAVRPVTDGSLGRGSGTVQLGYVECAGSEATLFDCPKSSWVPGNCTDHTQDVAVVCSDGRFCIQTCTYTFIHTHTHTHTMQT